MAERGVGRVESQSLAPRGESKVGTHGHEHEEREDLEGQAGNHNINACLLGAAAVIRRGDAPPGALQDQREDIETDEGYGIDGGAEARNLSTENDDDAGQADIDGGAEEGGSDCQADQVASEHVSIQEP